MPLVLLKQCAGGVKFIVIQCDENSDLRYANYNNYLPHHPYKQLYNRKETIPNRRDDYYYGADDYYYGGAGGGNNNYNQAEKKLLQTAVGGGGYWSNGMTMNNNNNGYMNYH